MTRIRYDSFGPRNMKEVDTSTMGYVTCAFSVCVFSIVNNVLTSTVPSQFTKNYLRSWRWKNILTSLIHSIITGFGAIWCFAELPKMAEDMIESHTKNAHLLVSLSTGYFIYDLLDMLLFNRSRSSYELMVHHSFVIVCFGISVVSRRYVGYAMAALVVELNNIFLHLRQLLLLVNFSKSHILYRVNSFINMGTFIIFRVVTLSWMTRWLVLHREDVPLPEYTCGAIGLAAIVLMSIVLFFRLFYSDYVLKPRDSKKSTKVQSERINIFKKKTLEKEF